MESLNLANRQREIIARNLGIQKGENDDLQKAHIKEHQMKTKSGKIVTVKEHEDKRQKKEVELKQSDAASNNTNTSNNTQSQVGKITHNDKVEWLKKNNVELHNSEKNKQFINQMYGEHKVWPEAIKKNEETIKKLKSGKSNLTDENDIKVAIKSQLQGIERNKSLIKASKMGITPLKGDESQKTLDSLIDNYSEEDD
jgi:hypothetical protein